MIYSEAAGARDAAQVCQLCWVRRAFRVVVVAALRYWKHKESDADLRAFAWMWVPRDWHGGGFCGGRPTRFAAGGRLPGALPATAGQRTDRLADGPAPARSPRLLGWPRGRVCEGSAESLGRHAPRARARRRASARAGPKEWGRCAFPPFSQPDVKGAWRQKGTGRHVKRVPEVAHPPRPRRPRPAAPRRRARARATPRRAGTRPEAKTEQRLPRRRHGGQSEARAGHRAALRRVRRGQALAREI